MYKKLVFLMYLQAQKYDRAQSTFLWQRYTLLNHAATLKNIFGVEYSDIFLWMSKTSETWHLLLYFHFLEMPKVTRCQIWQLRWMLQHCDLYFSLRFCDWLFSMCFNIATAKKQIFWSNCSTFSVKYCSTLPFWFLLVLANLLEFFTWLHVQELQ